MKRRRLLAAAVLVGLLALLYALRAQILPLAATWLDVGEKPRKADYVLVLGGDGNSRPFAAAAFLKAGLARKALVCNPAPSADVEDNILPPDGELAVQVLSSRGIAAENIIRLGKEVGSTHDEARALAAFLASEPGARVLVPTSAFHTRRARWVFRRILGRQSDHVTFVSLPGDGFHMETWWRTDQGFSAIVSENLKFAFYLFRYGRLPYALAAAGIALVIIARYCRRYCGGASSESRSVSCSGSGY
ncbi:MAG: YdcF family protein [Thermoguttaceae bacterium]|jgi:uncharacterized SAM-binding protein YcdF (DUF218 family)|nr:YdcF family protein [Thermoguttaceae bacterium]